MGMPVARGGKPAAHRHPQWSEPIGGAVRRAIKPQQAVNPAVPASPRDLSCVEPREVLQLPRCQRAWVTSFLLVDLEDDVINPRLDGFQCRHAPPE